jgi:hypothetical protein
VGTGERVKKGDEDCFIRFGLVAVVLVNIDEPGLVLIFVGSVVVAAAGRILCRRFGVENVGTCGGGGCFTSHCLTKIGKIN